MANPTWFDTTNNVLRQSGLSEISSSDIFLNAARLTRYQLVAREYVRHMHEVVSMDLPVEFARRKFQLNIDNTTAIFPLDTGISVESLTFDGFRNLTQGVGSVGKLYNWTYEYFTKRYPDTSLIYSGAPTHYILLPVDRTNLSPVYQVRIFPNPDRDYNLEYVAQLNAYDLTSPDSLLLWPKEYINVVESMSRAELEDILGEGKGANLHVMAQQQFAKARQKATRPMAEKKAVRMQKLFARRRFGTGMFPGSTGVGYYWNYPYYNSPPDSDAPYTIDPDTGMTYANLLPPFPIR